MLIVCAEEAQVEAELVDGMMGCPSCREVLGPWGHARVRVLRCRSGDRLLVPRRARCRGCAGTHVLLPEVALLRRQDEVSVIGEAIEASVAGGGVSGDRCTVGGAGGHGSSGGLTWSGRCSRGARSRLIPSSGGCCRRAASSRMRWRRWRSRPGRGCCGSGRGRCGRSSAGCRRAGCCHATRVPSRQGRYELRRSSARVIGGPGGPWLWRTSVAGRSDCSVTR
jgi:hypothetical protein